MVARVGVHIVVDHLREKGVEQKPVCGEKRTKRGS